MKLLYVTWDAPNSNYLESLFFPIFERLGRQGVQSHVVQFSWDLKTFSQSTVQSAKQRGIGYTVFTVPRQPLVLATGAAITLGAVAVARVARQVGADVVMPRSHIPAAIALAAASFLPAVRLIWDSDGLMPDERADFGGWSRDGVVYRAFLRLERAAVRRAERVMTRTERASALLAERSGVASDRFITVPNGKDMTEFSPGTPLERAQARHELGATEEAPLLTHVGSLGPQYQPQEMLELFTLIRARLPGARLLLLTAAASQARALFLQSSLPPEAVIVRTVAPSAVPGLLRACDGGIALRRPSLSQQAVSPIKIAEYLLCGVPVLANRGVGDLDVHLADSDAASLADDLSPASLQRVASEFVERLWPQRESVRLRCRALGERRYSLEACADGYARALGLTPE